MKKIRTTLLLIFVLSWVFISWNSNGGDKENVNNESSKENKGLNEKLSIMVNNDEYIKDKIGFLNFLTDYKFTENEREVGKVLVLDKMRKAFHIIFNPPLKEVIILETKEDSERYMENKKKPFVKYPIIDVNSKQDFKSTKPGEFPATLLQQQPWDDDLIDITFGSRSVISFVEGPTPVGGTFYALLPPYSTDTNSLSTLAISTSDPSIQDNTINLTTLFDDNRADRFYALNTNTPNVVFSTETISFYEDPNFEGRRIDLVTVALDVINIDFFLSGARFPTPRSYRLNNFSPLEGPIEF